MTLQPGQTLGRYQILEPLGIGGMASVYKAYQPSLEREVALKVLRPGFAEDPEFFERFQREARSIARLRHPNIVQIFDFEPLDGRYVLAMEFLEGGTLKDRVSALAAQGKRLPKGDIARIVGEVADALGYGHELGIVHRDVKPSNVMLTQRDRAVVTDFGIAKIVGGEGQTQTGVGIGTPEYMAPEQGTGGKVDQRADIYSLGVMAYEMLTGRVPFVADTPLAVVLAHVRDPLPLPSTVDPGVDAATERVLLKALAKDPADRYATAPEFAEALRNALVAPATAATVYPIELPPESAAAGVAAARTGLPRAALIGGALIVLLLVSGAAFALSRGGAPGGVAPSPTAAAGCAFPPCPSVPGGPGAGGGQASSGPGVALPAKGALIAQVDLKDTAAHFNISGGNQAQVSGQGVTIVATQGQPGIHAPPAPPPGTYGDLITEVRAAPQGPQGQYRVMFRTTGSAFTFVQVNLNPGDRLQVEIVRDDPAAGGARQLGSSGGDITTTAAGHTLLILRRGDQLAAFIDGRFAVSATDPKPEPAGLDLVVQPRYAPGQREPVASNTTRFESWAIYAIAGR